MAIPRKRLSRMLKSPFSKQVYEQNARIYKLMANPKRLEILNVIKSRDATVKDLAHILQLRTSNISQHLSTLLLSGLVRARRQGNNVFYRITDPKIVGQCQILKVLRKNKSV